MKTFRLGYHEEGKVYALHSKELGAYKVGRTGRSVTDRMKEANRHGLGGVRDWDFCVWGIVDCLKAGETETEILANLARYKMDDIDYLSKKSYTRELFRVPKDKIRSLFREHRLQNFNHVGYPEAKPNITETVHAKPLQSTKPKKRQSMTKLERRERAKAKKLRDAFQKELEAAKKSEQRNRIAKAKAVTIKYISKGKK